MTIEIKTASLDPIRHTYGHIERRFGNKPATRYQEATYDVQSEAYFHYRPLWQPDKELNDPSRTVITMADWYGFKDPRQFYYGTYVQQRAKMQENAESNYAFFEKRNLADRIDASTKDKLIRFLVPLRHVEHTANLNNMYACAYGYGTALTQACMFNAMDRLGIAQYLSRIGLMLDGNSGDALIEAKACWMHEPMWQGLRRVCEATTVTEDWFEVMVAQDVVLDILIYHLFYNQLDTQLAQDGAQDIGMLTEFMQQYAKDTNRWIDSVLKIAASESSDNKAQLEQWIDQWRSKALEALSPIASELLGVDALASANAELSHRLAKAGLAV